VSVSNTTVRKKRARSSCQHNQSLGIFFSSYHYIIIPNYV